MPFKSVKGIMDEWKGGALHSGSKTGPVVKNPKQAEAIALSEKRKAAGGVPGLMSTRNNLKNMRMDTMPKMATRATRYDPADSPGKDENKDGIFGRPKGKR